jgi:hypothetical protein
LTGGLRSCYVLILAGSRRADERRRNGRFRLEKGNRRIGSNRLLLQTPRERRAGARPLE